jgi:O-antigen/teichoic acid export membrane protein
MIIASSVFPSLVKSKQLGEQEYLRRIQKYFDLNAMLAYALSIPTSLLSHHIISLLYGDAYRGAEVIFSILIWSSIFMFIGVAREQYLLTEGRLIFSLICTTIGALINIALNMILIPKYTGVGAAISTVTAFAVSGYFSSFLIKDLNYIAIIQTKSFLIPFRLRNYFKSFGS